MVAEACMIFRPGAAAKVIAGEKTVTRRLVPDTGVCHYRVGKDYAVQPGRGQPQIGRILVVAIERGPLGSVETLADWRAEGFKTLAEFEQTWEQLHGSYDPDQAVDRIEFEVVT